MDASDNKELSTVEYWNQRYTKQTSGDSGRISAHEWFRSFKQMQPFFERRMISVPKDGVILHLGCGDSTLPAEMYGFGYQDQLCIDFSEVVIKQMKQRYESLTINWMVMDVRDIDIPDHHIDLAIDKGTLDAFLYGSMWNPPSEVRANVGKYVDGIGRVLKPGAKWIYITYRQPHFMKPLLAREQWDIEVEKLNDDAGAFDYFAFIMTKHAAAHVVR